MARTGNFGGFAFDEEVFTGMMQEADYWTTPIVASGIVQQDSSIMDLIGEHGNVATIPIYKPIDANESGMEALNNDGETNNTPVEISGDKQTCMLIQRMKAFKAKDFTKELTGADPMTLIRNKIAGYYGQVWEKELMNIAQAVLAVAALSDHVLDLTKGTKTNIEAGTIYDAEQAALGDMAGGLGLMVMHSMIFKEYKKMEMVDYDKYVVNGVIQKEITLPTIAGKHVLVTDRFTATGAGADAVYSTYLFGEGAFLSCDKNNYENQYTTNLIQYMRSWIYFGFIVKLYFPFICLNIINNLFIVPIHDFLDSVTFLVNPVNVPVNYMVFLIFCKSCFYFHNTDTVSTREFQLVSAVFHSVHISKTFCLTVCKCF